MKSVRNAWVTLLALLTPGITEKRQDMVEAFVEDHNTRRSLQVCLPAAVTGVANCPRSVGLFEAYAGFQSSYEAFQSGNRIFGGCRAGVPGSLKGARQMVQRRMQLTGVRFS
jgi:hypothetical protein